MTIERRVKYVASDGTEHDSPQGAARHDLEDFFWEMLERVGADLSARETADELSRNPEALLDAVNAYFEALEEHADVENVKYPTSFTVRDEDFQREAERVSAILRQEPISLRAAADQLQNHNDPSMWGPSCDGVMGVATPEEACRGTDCTAPISPLDAGAQHRRREPPHPSGNPNDPSTWRADLPVDHPNYCKPFGVDRE